MKKLHVILFISISILFFSCNKELKNSEAFVGTYLSTATVTGAIGITVDGVTTNIPIYEPLDADTFGIKLGDHDTEIILFGINYGIEGEELELKAVVTENAFVISPTEKIILIKTDEASFPLPAIISGNGSLVENTLTYNLTATGSASIMMYSATYNTTIVGTAERTQ